MYINMYVYMWPWVNTNYHQNWVGEHPNKDYYDHFWDVHHRVLTHSHVTPWATPREMGGKMSCR